MMSINNTFTLNPLSVEHILKHNFRSYPKIFLTPSRKGKRKVGERATNKISSAMGSEAADAQVSTKPAELTPNPAAPEDESTEPVELLMNHAVSELPSRFLLPPHLRPLAVCPIQIPLIDLALLHGDQRLDTLRQIHEACCEWGFFQVLNHGVSLEALHSLRTYLHEFFALPASAKCNLGLFTGDNGQGYGSGFVNPQAGIAEWKDYLLFHTYPPGNRDCSKWPSSLKDDVDLIAEQFLALSKCLLAFLSENLQLPSSTIEDAMGMLHQKIFIAHYPPCPQPDLAMGSCEHTDVGVITCVWQATEDVVGLQVRKDGKWHSVVPYPGAIVINIGDQIEILSNGLYKSGPHRVVLNTLKSRISVIGFHNPSAAAVVSPAAALINDQHPPKYEATHFKSYAAKYAIKAV